jgi:hypothetical protein
MTFVAGRELAARFYADAVRPALPVDLPHSAGLLGPGSDVLGFDTVRSTDHDWGPRALVFTAPADREKAATALADRLPPSFHGYPVGRDIDEMLAPVEGRARVGVRVVELGSWLTGRLGFDPRAGVTLTDWLTTPTQLLAEVTSGVVFADGLGELEPARARLAWYPDDVWRYVLACQWTRIAQEEAFVGRAGEVGDDLGSALVTARLVRDLMRLWLLMDRVYPPYGKWLGSALAAASAPGDLRAALAAAVGVGDWRVREEHLCCAYTVAAERHNGLGLAAPLDPAPRNYHDRPFRVIGGERFTGALLDSITDPLVRRLPLVGAVDQFIDSTDVLSQPERARAATLAALELPGRAATHANG